MGELITQLGIDWKLLLIQAANFLIILYLLKRFVFEKMLQFMDERQKRIQDGLEMREKAEQELQHSQEMRAAEIDRAKKEAQELIEQARTTGAQREQEFIAKARQEAEKMLKDAQQDITRQTDEAMKQARQDIAEMAITAAEKVLGRVMQEEDRTRMTAEVLESINKEPEQTRNNGE